MGIEKQNNQIGQQRDLFKDTEQELAEAAAPQPETLPSFAELEEDFLPSPATKPVHMGSHMQLNISPTLRILSMNSGHCQKMIAAVDLSAAQLNWKVTQLGG